MNVPNAISLFRIFLVPVFAFLYMRGQIAAAMAALLLSGVSDILDGAIARRFNMVTDLGKVLDPAADKLIQTAMMLCAVKVSAAVWWLLALHVGRELILSFLGYQVLRTTGQVHSAKWYGKLCTAAIYAAMLLILAFPGIETKYAEAAVLVCSLLVAYCLIKYGAWYITVLRAWNKKESSL